LRKFFTSDTHFGHAKAIEHGRPFASVQEMEEVMVERWNKVVSPEDTVFHLGDFAMGQREITIPKFAPRLLGRKILICGNHDYVGHIHKHKSKEKADFYTKLYNAAFNIVMCWTYDVDICGIPVALHHLPYLGDHKGMEERFSPQRPKPQNEKALIHGHVHDSWLVRQEEGLPPMINVGVDMWDFTPVAEEELEKWIR
jgi:calcineurin-like phosphoesterase family protein